jgi:hypothetical protein
LTELKSCISIDPSVQNCGLAVFIDNELITYDIIHPSKEFHNEDYLIRARDVRNKIQSIYSKVKQEHPNIKLVTEVPDHFGISGHVARETGAVYALTFVCGMIFGITQDTVAYKPRLWKGQMNKCIVRARLDKIYQGKVPLYFDSPEKKCADCGEMHKPHNLDHNIVDAIGIGYKYIFGRV